MNLFKRLLAIFLLIVSSSIFAENLQLLGTISCSPGGAQYSILKRLIPGGNGGTLASLYQNIDRKYLLLQTSKGKCSFNDRLTVYLKRPIEAFALIKFLSDIFHLQYVYEGDIKYKPTYVVLYRKDLTFKELFNFLKKQVKKNNKDLNLYIAFYPQNDLVIIAKEIPRLPIATKGSQALCVAPQVVNYLDLCKGNTCKRFYITWTANNIELHPYYECINNKPVYVTTTNTCQNKAPIGNIYLDKVNIIQLLTLFEKLFNIHFLYNADELLKIKGARNIHFSITCLTPEKALAFLQKTFHIYIKKLEGNNYRLFVDKDAYPLVLQEAAENVSKVIFLKGIKAKSFVKIIEKEYDGKVIYSVDPIFNSVTIIAPPQIIKDIETKFAKYIKNNQYFDDLMTKILYVKFGDPKKLEAQISQYLSRKGMIQYLPKARAFEITDYPINIAMVEKVFGRFLSQKPIKIKVTIKFVTADKSFTRSLGFNWAFVYAGNPIDVGSQTFGTYNYGSGGLESVISVIGESNPQAQVGLLAAQFSYRKFNPISLQLQAFETIGLAKTLDTPTLLLLNGQSASLSRGIQIPYQESAENGGTTIRLVSANMNLNITPTLLPDGRILLELQLSKNNPGGVYNGQTAINTFNINDSLIIANGDTVVIGGVVQKSKSKTENGIPLLRKIPLLGWLFKNVNWQNSNKELLVFITAQVVD